MSDTKKWPHGDIGAPWEFAKSHPDGGPSAVEENPFYKVHMGPAIENDLTYEQKLRVEALRAASRIWAASGYAKELDNWGDEADNNARHCLNLADRFLRYLETGER